MGRKKNALDRTEFIKVTKDHDVYALADTLLKGVPLVLNFEEHDVVASNQFILFLSGVIYAFDGQVEKLKEKILLFASKQDLKDKTLRKFIKDNKE